MNSVLLQSGLLAQALPVLLHKLANQTQLITGFHAILRMEGGESLVESRSHDLIQAGHNVEQVGWLLAALSSGAGHNLMLARREPRGLIWTVDLVDEILRKQGIEPPGFGQSLPGLTSHAPKGWLLPWVLGCMLFETYREGGNAPAWTLEASNGGEWRLRLPMRPETTTDMARFAANLGEARWEPSEGCLTFPAAWLQPSRA
ncbi:MAG: hypothetical protein GY930_18755 [bacterium]|nr:hypothetical protein [bacterium]